MTRICKLGWIVFELNLCLVIVGVRARGVAYDLLEDVLSHEELDLGVVITWSVRDFLPKGK